MTLYDKVFNYNCRCFIEFHFSLRIKKRPLIYGIARCISRTRNKAPAYSSWAFSFPMYFITGSASDILIIHLDKASRRGVTTRETAWLSFCNLASAIYPRYCLSEPYKSFKLGRNTDWRHKAFFFFQCLQTFNIFYFGHRPLPTFFPQWFFFHYWPHPFFNVYKLSMIFLRLLPSSSSRNIIQTTYYLYKIWII